MEGRLIVLKLFLDELGVKSSINTLDDRKTVQKAVYLGQAAGFDLGYRFSWYRLGPYSTNLTRDYYELAEEEQIVSESHGRVLRKWAKDLLNKAKPLLERPDDFKEPKSAWLELVASYHYQRYVLKKSDSDAQAVLQKEKGHLAKFSKLASSALKDAELLPAS